jgi:raffinose/stachyose/melibiose transport system substrate-binding protein
MTLGAQASNEVVLKFPHYQVPPAIGWEWRKATIDGFNKMYAGKYRVEMESVPSDQLYIEKIQVLAAADQLPPLFEIKQFTLGDTLANEGRLADLKPYFDADPAWGKQFIPSSVKFLTRNGKIVAEPAYSGWYAGIYYNKELFAKAGIKEFPTTWDAMLVACEKLKAIGVPAFAMMTGENAWTTGLILSGILASTPEGYDWFNTKVPKPDFEKSKPFLAAATLLQKLLKYAAPSSIGATYAVAQNTFVSGKAAMISNGPWMVGSFKDEKVSPPGFIDKVGYALMPGGVAISDMGLSWGMAISAKASQGERDAAAAYIKYTTTGDMAVQLMLSTARTSATVPIPAAKLDALDPVSKEAMSFGTKAKIITNFFGAVWSDYIVNVELPKDLPLLSMGKISPQEFAKRLTAAAQK